MAKFCVGSFVFFTFTSRVKGHDPSFTSFGLVQPLEQTDISITHPFSPTLQVLLHYRLALCCSKVTTCSYV